MPYKRHKSKKTIPTFAGYYPYNYGSSLDMSGMGDGGDSGEMDEAVGDEEDEELPVEDQQDDLSADPQDVEDAVGEDEVEIPEISRRTVPGTRLVNSTMRTDGLVEELWMAVDKKHAMKQNIVNAIIAGTDIDPETRQGKESGCGVVLWRRGNVQFIQVVCSPTVDVEPEDEYTT